MAVAVTLTMDERLRRAGAVMSRRDGQPVAAHFGSTATEMAICVKRVGVVVRSDLDALQVTGPEPWLTHLLACSLDAAPPESGHALRVAGTWCCRVSDDAALLIGPVGATARWARCVGKAVVSGSPIACARRSSAALTLVGPRAHRLLAEVGLDPDVPMHEGWLAGSPTLVLREAPDRYLLVVDAGRASDACGELFASGAAVGLAMVGTEALERLAARVSSQS
jgi:glycine cleavage system aminomethyltransferase T